MVVNVAAGCLGLVFIAAALGFPAPLLLESLNASGKQIGLLGSIQHIALAVQIPVAWFVGHLARRKGFWFVSVLVHRLLWCLPGLLPFCFAKPADAIPWILVAVGVSTLFDKASSPPWLSWMTDLIPERVSGRFWSIRQSIIFIPYLAGTWFYSWTLDHHRGEQLLHGFAIVFVTASIFGVVDILVHLGVPEPPPHRHRDEHGLVERIRAPLRLPDFRWLTFGMGAWLFTVGLQQTFAPVYCKQEFGFTYKELAALALCQNTGVVLAGLVLAKPLDRLGGRNVVLGLLIGSPLLNAGWFYTGEAGRIVVLGVMHLLLGGLYSGILLTQLKLLGSLSPKQDRVMAIAVHWTCIGAFAAAGPFLGGWVKDVWPAGLRVDYFHFLTLAHIALAWVVCLPLFRRIRDRRRHGPTMPAPESDPGQVGGF